MDITQWSLPQRRDHIKQLRSSGTSLYEYQLSFQSSMITLPVYAVDIGFPSYRLANGRTRAAQLEVIATKGLAEDFFSADPDSEPALNEQDSMLRQMVTEAGLLRSFKKVHQDQPLILDNDGYVVNGNRRLCTMKLLMHQDEDAYAHFKHIQVVFLPPCDERDIKELEGRLQVQPDIRADYSWTAEAMLYRDLRTEGWSDKQVADLYQKKIPEIRDIIAMLEDAEFYLESRGQRGLYSSVLKREFAFRQLQKTRQQCANDEPRKQFLTAVAHTMLDDPETGGGRLYEAIKDAFRFLDKIAEGIKRDFSDEIEDTDDGRSDLDILGDTSENTFQGLIEVVTKSPHADKVRDVIRDTIEEMRGREKERKDATYCFRQVQLAHTKLQSALGALDEAADTIGIDDTLRNIELVVGDIREWLSNADDTD